MGTWDWDLRTNQVRWSENLERVHGLPPGTFDGSFASYEREIHPEDRERVLASARAAIADGVPHDVEYRIVAPDGTVRWVEGKGQVERRGRVPVRMTGVCMVVTRRKEAELARLAAAEESNRLKDEFLATLSHELRTPLNAMLGWLHMLQAGSVAPDRMQHTIEIIARNATLQGRLIEDLLDVSRIIRGEIEIERVPLPVPPLLDVAVTGVLPAAAAKGLRVTSHVPAELPVVVGDVRRLQQVLGNVLQNAIKFTPEGGSIEIRARAEGGQVRIDVDDSGIGVDPAFLPMMFERFSQAQRFSERGHGGLGLGLAIARHLVEQHGGAIRAMSDGRGCGTRIVITLPAATAVPGPVAGT
jgi:signal transduction histidine kinase